MRSTLVLIFFLSGASALIFEALWFRLAGLSLGNSVWSASLVLAAFMGGLAVGNGLVARLHRRIFYPLRLYAVLELAIGIGGIVVVLLLPRLPDLLAPAFGNLTEMPVLLNAVRLTLSFGILLIPAIAMGATLPVVTQALSRQDPNFGANIGLLYGANTLGAMLGAFCTEVFLVPAFGILSSGLIAVALNLVAALIALQLSETHESAPMSWPEKTRSTQAITLRSRRFLAVAFLSGALMLALEVVWFRFLLLSHDGTSLIFAVMLAIVLAGIGLGGIVAAHLFHRDERAYRWLRHLTAISAALVVLTYWGYDFFTVYRSRNDITTLEFVWFATFLMIPVAVLSGVAFTMVSRAVKEDLGSSVRTAGIATLYNTIGAMLGSLGAGFILLPNAGMELSLFLIAATYCLVALIVPSEAVATRLTTLSARAAVIASVVCLLLFPFGLMQRSYFSVIEARLPEHTLVTTREGLVETVRYYRQDVFGEPLFYRLVTNGYSMSGTSTMAKRYMKLYVYLPLVFKPDTRDALLVSFGVGTTAKALTDSNGLENIDIVDISEDILELSTTIYPGEDNPLRDKRVRVHVEDGRFFLNTTSKRYDLITSEPPPPKIAGVVNLYSQEYFELIRTRLNVGGYASYWLPVHQLEQMDTLAIIKAFCNAFDDCSLWAGAGLEWMLLGSNGAKPQNNMEQFSAQWREPYVGRELVSLGFETPAQVASLFMADSEYLMGLTANVAPVTDNHPSRISSRMVKDPARVQLYDTLMDVQKRLERFRRSEQINRFWPKELKESSEPYFQHERMIKYYFTAGVYQSESDPFVWEAIDDILTNTSLTTLPQWLLGTDQRTLEIVTGLIEQEGYRDDFALELALKHVSERDYEAALRYAGTHIATAGGVSEQASSLYLYLMAKNGIANQAKPLIANLQALDRPGLNRFLEWYSAKFDVDAAENHERPDLTAVPEEIGRPEE
ncbi:MAG: hypothetical protein ACR2PS_15735 [Pseudomonadales bacterium]